jgi:hypothetical protein
MDGLVPSIHAVPLQEILEISRNLSAWMAGTSRP